VFLYNTTSTESFVQELRYSSEWDHPVNFLAGVYYENRKPTITQFANWEGNPSLDPFEGELLADDISLVKVEQLAFFGELYWDINEKLTVTAGMRHFRYEKSQDVSGDGLLVDGPYRELSSAKEDDNIYKLNLSYRPNERALYYAQFSQGFRLVSRSFRSRTDAKRTSLAWSRPLNWIQIPWTLTNSAAS
jgi:outer membrane receptor protein involved in Fe transport